MIMIRDDPLVRRIPEERLEHERYLHGAVDETLETPVATRLDDGAVELLVEPDERPDLLLVLIEPPSQSFHLLGQLPQPLQLMPLYVSRRPPRSVALQDGAK